MFKAFFGIFELYRIFVGKGAITEAEEEGWREGAQSNLTGRQL